MPSDSLRLSLQLGVTQTIGYASSYYLPAILAAPMAAELGIRFEFIFLYVASASILAGFLGPLVGKLIDQFGGRLILPAGSVGFSLGLLLMANSTGAATFFAAWLVMGIGTAMALYDAAFATAVEVLGQSARRTIASITLIAGFASTIGWPITSAIEQADSWRTALVFWAVVNLVICLPLHLFLPGYSKQTRRSRRRERKEIETGSIQKVSRLALVLTALLFLIGGSIQVVMGAHLPGILASISEDSGLGLLAATLLGPGQVFARLLQVLLPNRLTPVRVAWFALLLHPLGALTLVLGGAPMLFVFSFVHGMGSGFLTVAAGVLPLYLFGAKNYGQRQGIIMAASDILLGFAPFLFGFLVVSFGGYALAASSAAALTACLVLFLLLRVQKPHS